MQNKEGVFIVIEGTDGSGKSTQFEILTRRLEDAGYDVATFKFPQYAEPSSYFVKQYLSGAYGTVDKIGPYTASLFYALDRYAAAAQIRAALSEGKIVVVDRYTGSNMAHQGAKFYHADQRRGYFIWLDNLEFEMLKIPRPDANFVLNVPATVSQKLLTQSEKKRDIHETDLEHLKRSVEVFTDLCQLFPKDFIRVDCVRNEELLPKEIVSNLIWEKVFPLLPIEKRHKKSSSATAKSAATASEDNPYIESTRTGTVISAAGRELLHTMVTDHSADIYAFRDQFDATTLAATIALSSQSDQDVRKVLLDLFSDQDKTGDALMHDMVQKYTSHVQKLIGLHLQVEQQSLLASTTIEQSRRPTFIHSTAYAGHYDEKDAHGQYKYYTPENLKGQLAQDYRTSMDTIFDNYTTIVERLTHYLDEHSFTSSKDRQRDIAQQASELASAALPVAIKTSTHIFASAKDIHHLCRRLLTSPLPEVQNTGRKLLEQATEIAPAIFEHFSPHAKQATSPMQQLADDYLSERYAESFTEPVQLSDFWPRNEFDLIPDMLFSYSSLPLTELKRAIDKWPYERKAEVFTAYMKDRANQKQLPGHALEKAHYTWDVVSDYITFRSMLRHQMVDNLSWQQLTPRNGFEVPSLIEEAGLADIFEACFDLSLELHSKLYEAGYQVEAQYATLMGHRLRWTATYNARESFHLYDKHTSKHAPQANRILASLMHEKIAEVHPMIADALS